MSIEAQVNTIINNALTTAQTKVADASSYADQAMQAASTLIVATAPDEIDDFNTFTIQPHTSFFTDLAGDFEGEADSQATKILNDLDSRFSDFLDTYYPSTVTRFESARDWIDNQILNGGSGINADVESQVWDRARSREDKLALRSIDDALYSVGRRGWPTPPGVDLERLQMAEQENLNKQATLERDIAIKTFETEVQVTLKAVEFAIDIQTQAQTAVAAYISAIVAAYNSATNHGEILAKLTGELYDYTLKYYTMKLSYESERVKTEAVKYNAELDTTRLARDIIASRAETMTNAAISAAVAMGNIGSAAMGSITSHAGLLAKEITSV